MDKQESDASQSDRHQNTITSTSVNQHEEKSVTNEIKQREITTENIQAMLDSIAVTPVKKQLHYVICLLAEAGEPLALFPDIHRIPSVKRWFELRRGIKRSLTKKENGKQKAITISNIIK